MEPVKVEQCGPQEISHIENHTQPLTQPEILNNERNRGANLERTPTTVTKEERRPQDAERYGFPTEGRDRERPLTKINSIKLQPAQAAAIKTNIASPQTPTEADGSAHHSLQVNGSGEQSPADAARVPLQQSTPNEPDRTLSRTSSMQQLEQWVRTQRGRNQDDDTRRLVGFCDHFVAQRMYGLKRCEQFQHWTVFRSLHSRAIFFTSARSESEVGPVQMKLGFIRCSV